MKCISDLRKHQTPQLEQDVSDYKSESKIMIYMYKPRMMLNNEYISLQIFRLATQACMLQSGLVAIKAMPQKAMPQQLVKYKTQHGQVQKTTVLHMLEKRDSDKEKDALLAEQIACHPPNNVAAQLADMLKSQQSKLDVKEKTKHKLTSFTRQGNMMTLRLSGKKMGQLSHIQVVNNISSDQPQYVSPTKGTSHVSGTETAHLTSGKTFSKSIAATINEDKSRQVIQSSTITTTIAATQPTVTQGTEPMCSMAQSTLVAPVQSAMLAPPQMCSLSTAQIAPLVAVRPYHFRAIQPATSFNNSDISPRFIIPPSSNESSSCSKSYMSAQSLVRPILPAPCKSTLRRMPLPSLSPVTTDASTTPAQPAVPPQCAVTVSSTNVSGLGTVVPSGLPFTIIDQKTSPVLKTITSQSAAISMPLQQTATPKKTTYESRAVGSILTPSSQVPVPPVKPVVLPSTRPVLSTTVNTGKNVRLAGTGNLTAVTPGQRLILLPADQVNKLAGKQLGIILPPPTLVGVKNQVVFNANPASLPSATSVTSGQPKPLNSPMMDGHPAVLENLLEEAIHPNIPKEIVPSFVTSSKAYADPNETSPTLVSKSISTSNLSQRFVLSRDNSTENSTRSNQGVHVKHYVMKRKVSNSPCRSFLYPSSRLSTVVSTIPSTSVSSFTTTESIPSAVITTPNTVPPSTIIPTSITPSVVSGESFRHAADLVMPVINSEGNLS